MSETSQPVTPQYLLEGAAYALEQCGWLLRDANTLYKAGAYANAVVLASFAREELGRWTMLLDLRREVVGGKQLTVDDVKERCGDHVAKQKAAMLSTTMRTNKDTGLGKLLNAQFTAKPGSSERKAADKQVDDIDRRLQKRVPGERHEQRMSALYVDPISPTEWNRPSEASRRKMRANFSLTLRTTTRSSASATQSCRSLRSQIRSCPKRWLSGRTAQRSFRRERPAYQT